MSRRKPFRAFVLIALSVGVAILLAATFFASRNVLVTIDAGNSHMLRQIDLVDDDIRKVVWSPDGGRVAFVRWEQPVEIRNARTLRVEHLIAEDKEIIHFAFSRDPDVVAFCENGTEVEIHHLDDREVVRIEASNHQPRMSFSPDGEFLATGGYGRNAMLFKVESGRLRWSFDTGTQVGGLTPVFSPDGQLLAVGNRNSQTSLFDIATGELVRRLPRRSTQGLAFSPDGSRLAVSYVDGNVGLWNVSDGQLHYLEHAGEEIYRVAWSPDGMLMVSVGRNADVIFWNPQDLRRRQEITERFDTIYYGAIV